MCSRFLQRTGNSTDRPSSGLIYAQAEGGTGFYRYRASTDTWESLAPAPIIPFNNGGAAIIGGKVYTSYASSFSIGVYDIATNSWTTALSGLPSPSGNIASDGTYLYFAQGNNLLRNTPGTGFFLGMAQLPVAYDPADILLETVRVLGTVPADPGFTEYTDFNANGIPDRKMRFPRTAFVMALPETDSADVVVTGEVRDRTVFVARDRIRIKRPRIAAPNGGEILAAGSLFPVVWEKPAGMEDLTSTLAYWSASAQAWVPIADGLTGTTFAWQMPDEPSETCRLRVATAAACDRSWTGPSPRAATR